MSHPAGSPVPGGRDHSNAGATLPSTRLFPPRLRANLVKRASLLDRLGDDPERRLTLICAPAGYGKSTLAGQWVANLALPTAWVTLEAADNDPRSFFGLVVAALHRIDRELAAAAASLLARGRDASCRGGDAPPDRRPVGRDAAVRPGAR